MTNSVRPWKGLFCEEKLFHKVKIGAFGAKNKVYEIYLVVNLFTKLLSFKSWLPLSSSSAVFWMSIPLSRSDGQYVGSTGLNTGPRLAHVTFVWGNTKVDANDLYEETHRRLTQIRTHIETHEETQMCIQRDSIYVLARIFCFHKMEYSLTRVILCEDIFDLKIFCQIWSLPPSWPKISSSLYGDV